jgi:hypothetical protein
MAATLTTVYSYTNTSVAIAYDYSPYFERIATSLETIVGSLNRIPSVFTTGSGILTTGINTTTLRLTTGTVSVSIDNPHIPNGVKPTFTVGTTLEGIVTNITIVTPGVGYIHPPIVYISDSLGIVATGTGVLTTDISVFTKLKDLSISASSSTQSLETIATQSVTLASQTTIIATNTTAISNTLSDIEGHQQKVRELAEGTGIRTIGPYDVFGMVSIYRLLIEKAKILETDGTTATLAQKTASLAEVNRLVDLIKTNISREF